MKDKDKVLEFDPRKRFTKKEWQKFKDWVATVEHDEIESVVIFTMVNKKGEDSAQFERYAYGCDWAMAGLIGCELDMIRHELSSIYTGVDVELES